MDDLLPLGWKRTTLESIATWGSGGTPSRKNSTFFKGNIPWIKTGELGDKFVRDSSEKITEQAVKKSSAKVFRKGSVGIAMYGATIGKLSIFGIHASTNQACAVAHANSRLLFNEFLYYFLLSEKKSLIRAGKGGAQPNISQGLIKDWEIALPPLNEQHRIVTKIETLFSELDKGIASLKTAREQFKVYRQSLLKHAFEGKLTEQWREDKVNGAAREGSLGQNGDKLETADELLGRIQQERETRYQQQLADWTKAVVGWEKGGKEGKRPSKPKKIKVVKGDQNRVYVKLPDSWFWASLGENNAHVFDGPFGSNLKTSDYVASGVRVIRLENIGSIEFIDKKKSYVSEEKYETLKKHTVKNGDIVFSSFVTERTRVTLVPKQIEKAINKADCFCVRIFGETLDSKYLTYYLSSRATFKQIEEVVHGVGRPRINTTQLKGIMIPQCSYEEQIAIVREVEVQLSELKKLDADIQDNIVRCEALRQSILKKAFSGQLVPQDPNDEPASELLKRIAIEKAESEAAAKAVKSAAKKNRKKAVKPK